MSDLYRGRGAVEREFGRLKPMRSFGLTLLRTLVLAGIGLAMGLVIGLILYYADRILFVDALG